MSKFTDRLWRELVREQGPDLAEMKSPFGAAHRRRARPRVLAGTGAGLAGVVTAAVLIIGAASSSPAFAVTRNRDGSYSVRVETWSAIPAANRALHGLGLHAQVVAVSAGCGSAIHTLRLTRAVGDPTPALIRARVLARQARIDPRRIPAGKTLMIPAWRVGRQVRMMPTTVVGAAPACMAPPCALHVITEPAPGNSAAPAPGNSGNSGNSGAGVASSGSGGGNSGAALQPSTTELRPIAVPVPRKAQVPVTVTQQLVHLAKLAAKGCPAPGAGAPPPSSGNSNNSGNTGNS